MTSVLAATLPTTVGPDELRKLNQAEPSRYPFLLQSTSQGGDLGRYDILFAFPGESLSTGHGADGHTRFLDALDEWWADERIPQVADSKPFVGGWFLYLGYELAAEVEPSLHLRDDPLLPVAFAVRCPAAIIFDHETQLSSFVFEGETAVDMVKIVEAA